jgi:8-oxo-dGTP pyrophosphatase MutT (NUDIX family)
MKIENFVATRGVILNSRNEILIVSRDAIIWELPGGGCDYDKSSSEMCVQEVYEEVGLNVEVEHFTGVFEYCMSKDDIIARNVIFYYKCKIIGSEEIDQNWKDLGYDVIKFRKFVAFDEFKLLNGRKSLSPIQKMTIEDMQNFKGVNFGFINYLND